MEYSLLSIYPLWISGGLSVCSCMGSVPHGPHDAFPTVASSVLPSCYIDVASTLLFMMA